MAFDAHKNLAISAVVTAPTPATSGTSLSVTAGEGVRFPAPPFNATVWPSTAMPTPANGEVIRVTARATDVLTITRAQEGSTARPIGTGDLIAATITAKTLTDLETQAALKDAANVFTADQELRANNPRLVVTHPTEAVDAKVFDLINFAQALSVRALNDAQNAVLAEPLRLNRLGDVFIARNLSEKGRATPVGHAQTWTPVGTTAEGAAIGGAVTGSFALIGQTLFWNLSVTSFSIPAITAALRVTVPPGYGATGGTGLMRLYVPGVAYQWGAVDAGPTHLSVVYPAGNWPAGAGHLWGQGFYFTTGT